MNTGQQAKKMHTQVCSMMT